MTRRNRLRGYDYTAKDASVVTICTYGITNIHFVL